ncbi:MAG: aminoacyl-histidine dipeptidase [Lachnospiraceae bacterium]|nr:aminoacyl-histidine dipeptidase [Lachnospiraceae bacterium]
MIKEKPEPKRVYDFFEEIAAIPHGSYHIDEISDYLYQFARKRNLWCRQDEWKNVLIKKPATPGYENAPVLMIQGHMDMVAVKKDDCPLDLERDGLDLILENGFLSAKGTSLGGDDGIAVAYALAILDSDSIPHPALEVLFTVNEEVGMEGALGVELADSEATCLLNIDSEEEGILIAGCAGGVRVAGSFPFTRVKKEGTKLSLSITGLKGGHSGTEIHKGRCNANCVMGRILTMLSETVPYAIVSLKGGEKDNAIPRFAHGEIIVDKQNLSTATEKLMNIKILLKQEFGGREDGFSFEVKEGDNGSYDVVTEEDSCRMAEFLSVVPDGVVAMSARVPGMVETSLNLGILELKEEKMETVFALRSSIKSAKEALKKRMEALVRIYGGTSSCGGDYPAWEYRAESPLREKMVRIYQKQYGKEPEITVIHAGLECGILLEKKPSLDCVSFGPDILDIHTTEEKMDVASVLRTWEYLLAVLEEKVW